MRDLLDRVLTCDISNMKDRSPRPGALLTPQGKIIADFLLEDGDDETKLHVSPLIVDVLEKRLKLFRLRAKVDIARGEDLAVAEDETARCTAGLPAFGKDFGTGDIFPTDINLDLRGGIAYQKGCFVGQEVVSRMKRRGKIRKRTVPLTGKSLEAGADLRAGAQLIGKVTSAEREQGLALLRLDHLSAARKASTSLSVNEMPAEIVDPDWLEDALEALSHDNT